MLKKRCEAFLAYMKGTSKREIKINDIQIFKKFSYTFLEKFPNLYLKKEVKSTIDLIPSSAPISKAQYRMTYKELKELKIQSEKILKMGFIQPSISSWDTLVLFLINNDIL